MKNYLGQIVYFDEVRFESAKNEWFRNLIPAINQVSEEYSLLQIGDFDQTIFNDLLQYGTKNVKTRHEEALKMEIHKMGGILLADVLVPERRATDKIITLEEAVKKFHRFTQAAEFNMLTLFPEDVTIEEGTAFLNVLQLRRRYEVRLDSDRKAQAYDYLIRINALCTKFRKFLNKQSDGPAFNVFGDKLGSDFMWEDGKGNFETNFQLFDALK
jgi:hypothetical protein